MEEDNDKTFLQKIDFNNTQEQVFYYQFMYNQTVKKVFVFFQSNPTKKICIRLGDEEEQRKQVRQKMQPIKLGSFNSIKIGNDNRLYNTMHKSIDIMDSPQQQRSDYQQMSCNCKRSKCIKLYCECFAYGEYCQDYCQCHQCRNQKKYKSQRNSAIKQFKMKNDEDAKIVRGCNCKRSGCLKKYCECFSAGSKCHKTCKCENCNNQLKVEGTSNESQSQEMCPQYESNYQYPYQQ